tara:strand:- start:1583 stop:2368 length:786 start_codon:yes stop_codon:yes gene_type:complete
MGSLAGKSPANTYKSLLKVADETNGVSGTASQIEDGEGTSTCISVGDDNFKVKPQSDNTTTTFEVENASGSNLLTVDSSNSVVKVGTSQVSATTQLLTFNGYRIVPVAGTHYFVPLGTTELAAGAATEISMGTGTDPDTSADKGTSTYHQTYYVWNVPFNITIDAVKVLASNDSDADCVYNYHLMSYTMVADGSTNDGNLSGGVVLADGQATAVDRSVIKSTDLTIQSSSVTSGKVIACLVENETNTNDINIQVQVKYHIA